MRAIAIWHLIVAAFAVAVIFVPPVSAPSTFFLGLAAIVNLVAAYQAERDHRREMRA